MPAPPPHLTVLLETSCLSDARSAAGIGRYARQLRRSLGAIPGLDVISLDVGAPRSESRPWRFAHAQLPVFRAGTRHKPHLIHGVGGEPALGFPMSRQVVSLHDVELWKSARPGGPRGAALATHARLQAGLIRRCGGVLAISQASADEAVDLLGLDPERVHVVPLAVGRVFNNTPAPYDGEVLASLGLREDGYLLWAGSLRHHDPRKGLDVLIAAVARLDDSRPLALVGAPGAESERISALAAEHGVDIVLCGRLPDSDLATLYRYASCMVISSDHEGFGFTALEAMASGCPVVSTDGGNLADLVGGVGITVPIRDAAALSRGVRDVLSNATRREELRRRGLVRAAEHTWQRCAADTAAVYRTVADRQAKSSANATR